MSKELQDQAEKIMRELMDSLVPIKEELNLLRGAMDKKETGSIR